MRAALTFAPADGRGRPRPQGPARLALVAVLAVTSLAVGAALEAGDARPAGAATSFRPFTPITPCRVADTRVIQGPFPPGAARTYRVAGTGPIFASQGGVPGGCDIPTNAVAVEATVTAVGPDGAGFVRTWPAGTTLPQATFLNFTRGRSIGNSGTVALTTGTTGAGVTVGVFGAGSHLVIDVQGYFGDTGGYYQPVTPCRLLDTRVAGGAFAAGEAREVQVTGSGPGFAAQGGTPGGCGVPSKPTAAQLTITAVGPASDGFLRAWPGDTPLPGATFLNMTRGTSIGNSGALAVSTGVGMADLAVQLFGAGTHLVIDIDGYFSSSPDLIHGSQPPCRVVDTRLAGGALAPGERRDITLEGSGAPFAAQGGTPGGCGLTFDPEAVVVTITAVGPTSAGFLRAWPSGTPLPGATFLNMSAGINIGNTGTASIATTASRADLAVQVFGTGTHLVIDVQAYYSQVVV